MTAAEQQQEGQVEDTGGDGDQLRDVLVASLKAKDVRGVMQKLVADEVEYEDVFDSSEQIVMQILGDAGVGGKQQGRIIRYLKKIPNSGVAQNPIPKQIVKEVVKEVGVPVVVSTEQSDFIAGLRAKLARVTANAGRVKQAMQAVTAAAAQTTQQMSDHYTAMAALLQRRHLSSKAIPAAAAAAAAALAIAPAGTTSRAEARRAGRA